MTKLEKDGLMEILAMPIVAYAIIIRLSVTTNVVYKLQKRWETKLEKEGLMEFLAMPIRC